MTIKEALDSLNEQASADIAHAIDILNDNEKRHSTIADAIKENATVNITKAIDMASGAYPDNPSSTIVQALDKYSGAKTASRSIKEAVLKINVQSESTEPTE